MSPEIELTGFRLLEVKLEHFPSVPLSETSGKSLMTLDSRLQLNKQDNTLVRLLFYSEMIILSLKLVVVSESRFKKTGGFTNEEVNSDETVKLLIDKILSKHLTVVKSLVDDSGYKIPKLPETIEEFERQSVDDSESST